MDGHQKKDQQKQGKINLGVQQRNANSVKSNVSGCSVPINLDSEDDTNDSYLPMQSATEVIVISSDDSESGMETKNTTKPENYKLKTPIKNSRRVLRFSKTPVNLNSGEMPNRVIGIAHKYRNVCGGSTKKPIPNKILNNSINNSKQIASNVNTPSTSSPITPPMMSRKKKNATPAQMETPAAVINRPIEENQDNNDNNDDIVFMAVKKI